MCVLASGCPVPIHSSAYVFLTQCHSPVFPSPGWSHTVLADDCILLTLLPPSPKCWDNRCVPPCLSTFLILAAL